MDDDPANLLLMAYRRLVVEMDRIFPLKWYQRLVTGLGTTLELFLSTQENSHPGRLIQYTIERSTAFS